MEFRAQLEREHNFVRVEISGEWELPSATVMLESAVATSRRERASKVLLDATRATGALTTVEQLELATSLASLSKSAISFCILCTPGQAERQACLETFAVNRGAMVKTLTDADEALRWAAAGPAPSEPGRIIG